MGKGNNFSATTFDGVRLGMATGVLDEEVGRKALEVAESTIAKIKAGEDCSDEPFGLLQCNVDNEFLDQTITVRIEPTLRGVSSRVTLFRDGEVIATMGLAEFMAAKEGVENLLLALAKQVPELFGGRDL